MAVLKALLRAACWVCAMAVQWVVMWVVLKAGFLVALRVVKRDDE